MNDICCIGHITLDKVVTPNATIYMAGGTSFYFSNAIRHLSSEYVLITSLAEAEIRFVDELKRIGINVRRYPSTHTVYFENIYRHDMDHREQRVIQTADPFIAEQLQAIDAKLFHLGPLLSGDIPETLIPSLAKKGLVSLDVQGYLREVRDEKVIPIDWKAKKAILPFVHILKANEHEMELLTGQQDTGKAALLLAQWGVQEVVITLGSKGSVIYSGGVFHDVPAYPPSSAVDATGCGDTYMAGYLSQRVKGIDIPEAGRFGAAMATLKIQASGPFTGNEADVRKLLHHAR